ncbi:MAG: T9SS type A sorting domain-containing protein, partial [Bacteroidetes bacterium]|nr:T9SS type A sorting domain-containing protein [Bacteroidota bacterium]
CSSSSEGITIDFNEVRTDGDCTNNYTLTRTWTATDECGNSTSHVQTITVQDTTAPVFDGEVLPQDMTVDCDAVPEAYNLSASDNCSSSSEGITIDFTEVRTDGDCPNNYTLTRTWTATDECGNSTSHAQTITVQDTTAPVFDGEVLPQDIMVDCEAIPEAYILSASDNCSSSSEGITIDFTEERINGECEQYFTLIRTWTATDECGNSTSHVQNITVQDTTAPVFDGEVLPQDITVDCDAVPEAYNLSASDNCSSSSEGITIDFNEVRTDGDCTNNYTLTRTWTATDECGNSTSHVQTVTVQDTTKPVLTITDPFFANVENGQTLVIQCRAMDKDWELPTLLDSEITISDNCGTPTYTMTQDVLEGTCSENGYFKKIVVKIKVTDLCYNEVNLNFDILVVDTIAPVFTRIPEDVTVSCEEIDKIFEISATDECECAYISSKDTTIAGGLYGNYTILRTYTAKDCCGNFSTYTQKIYVVDRSGPELISISSYLNGITNGDTLTRSCGEIEIPEWLHSDASKLMTAVDACSGNAAVWMDVKLSNQDACWNYGYLKLYTVTFNAVDDHGNPSVFMFYIKIEDKTPPVVRYIEETVCETDSTYPFVFDNCSEITYSFVDEPISGSCPQTTDYIRTWTFSDACGNTSYATQYVTGNDHKAPVMSLVDGPFKGELNGSVFKVKCSDWSEVDEATLLSWMGAQDECDIFKTVVKTFINNGDCIKDGYSKQINYVWFATDNCGNTSQFSLYIQLIDDEKPYFIPNAAEIYVDCESKIPMVRAYDNCSSVDLKVESYQVESNDKGVIIYNEKYIAVDGCGNSAVLTRKVYVDNKKGPIIYAPEVVCEGDAGNGKPYALDYCSNKPVPLKGEKSDKIYECDGGKYYEVTYTATDDFGNTTTMIQRVIIDDRQAPSLAFSYDFMAKYNFSPANPVIEVSSEEFNTLVNAIGKDAYVEVLDNCSVAIPIVKTQELLDTYCDEKLIHTDYHFAWTATDVCGNSSGLNLIVKMSTSKVPDMSFVPKDTTVYCLSKVPIIATPALTCGFVKIDTKVVNETPKANGDYDEVRIWTIENACGERYSASQTIHHLNNDASLSCSIIAPQVFCNSSENIINVDVTGGSGEYTYYWEVLNGSCHIISGQGTSQLKISIAFKTLQLKLTVADANGCTSECLVNVPCSLEGVDPLVNDQDNNQDSQYKVNSLSAGDYSLRPNPTTEQVTVEFATQKAGLIKIQIMDQLGKVVLMKEIEAVKGFNSEILNTSKFVSGIYYVVISSTSILHTMRLIKMN